MLSAQDFLLSILLVAVWGINFVFIRIGLDGFPPILLGAVRFLLSALPAVFFIPRPKCSWRMLTAFGFVIFALQFSFLFAGMEIGMSPGLASLLMQIQVFITMGLSTWILKEKLAPLKLLGAAIAFGGILVVAFHAQGEVTALGLTFILLAALSWAVGNVLSKRIGRVNALALVVWGSLVASPFLIFLSLAVDGPTRISESLSSLSWRSAGAMAYLVYLSTHLGYSLWGYLLNKYPAATIAPFTLLVPVFGFAGSVIVLHEPVPDWKLWAGALVIAGLALNVLSSLQIAPRKKVVTL